MSLTTRPTLAIAAALCCAALSGCDVSDEAGEPIYSLELREAYEDKGERAVGVSIDIAQGQGEILKLNNVRLEVTPTPPHSLNKLESQLDEIALHGGESQGWPTPVLRPVPQAVPVLTRVQTALAVMRPGDLSLERATVNVFESPPSLGFMRLQTRGERISVSTVALTAIASRAVTAFAQVEGVRTSAGKPYSHGFTLEGKRWILGESTARLQVSGQMRPADAPAQK